MGLFGSSVVPASPRQRRARPPRAGPPGRARTEAALPAAGAPPDGRSLAFPLAVGGGISLIAWAGIAGLAGHVVPLTGSQAVGTGLALGFVTVALALLGASVGLLLGQVVGEPYEWLPVGAGLLIFGMIQGARLIVGVIRTTVLPGPDAVGPAGFLALVAMTVGLCLLAWPALRVLRQRVGLELAQPAVTTALLLLTAALVLTGLERLAVTPPSARLVAGASLAIAATVLAGAAARAWSRERQPLTGMLAVSLGLLAQSGVVIVLEACGVTGIALGGSVLRLGAVGCAGLATLMTLRARLAGRVNALRESEATRRTLERRVRAQRRIAADTRHELRATLLAMDAGLHVLTAGGDALDSAPAREAVACLRWGVEGLATLAVGVGAGGSGTDLRALLVVAAASARERGALVRVDAPAAIGWVTGGSEALGRALRVLLDNARVHAVASPVLVSARADGRWCDVAVEDCGPGVAEHLREAIFRRGFRADSGVEGEGLGLHIARRIAREQGGDLWAEPRPGGGARFVLRLPRLDSRGERR